MSMNNMSKKEIDTWIDIQRSREYLDIYEPEYSIEDCIFTYGTEQEEDGFISNTLKELKALKTKRFKYKDIWFIKVLYSYTNKKDNKREYLISIEAYNKDVEIIDRHVSSSNRFNKKQAQKVFRKIRGCKFDITNTEEYLPF